MKNKFELFELLVNGSDEALLANLTYIYPSDILDIIHDDDIEEEIIVKILERLPSDMIASLLDEEEEEDKYELLLRVSKNKHPEVLDEMSSDELADMISTIDDKEVASDLIDSLPVENRSEVIQLMSYEPDTAGGIMATEFINIYDNKTVRGVLEYLQEIKDDVESHYALYVTDRLNTLKGVVSLSEIATTSFETPITQITNPNVITCYYDQDQEDVIKLFDKYNLPVIPVIDYDNHILGIVTFDDIIEVIQQEATEDIHKLAGIDADETADSTVSETIRSRLPWLVVNLFTAMLASVVISMFSDTIEQVVILAALMPVVTGMGGNAGSQTYTFTIRSIAIGQIDDKNRQEVLNIELLAALFNSVIIAVLVFFISAYISRDIHIGLIVGAAMAFVIFVSAFLGYVIPNLLNRLKIDPAIASSVFVTTFTDIIGFISFLGLATIFLEYII